LRVGAPRLHCSRNERLGSRLTADENLQRTNEIIRHLDPSDRAAAELAIDCALVLTFMSQPVRSMEIVSQFGASSGGLHSNGFPSSWIVGLNAVTLGDRDGFDRALDLTVGHEQLRRTSWWFNAYVMQGVAMGAMLDGDWGAAEAAVAEVMRVGGHYMNFTHGCHGQRTWIARETGNAEMVYQQSLGTARSDFPAARAGVVSVAAEAGHIDHVLALLDELAPDDFAAVGRGWLTVLILGDLAWGVVTADATAHATVLRRLLHPYSGEMVRVASGVLVMCSIDRLLAGLAAVDGDHAEADRLFPLALAQEEALRAPPLATRTRHWWGRALARRGETHRARPLLAEARAAADELGMRGVVAQIDDLTSGNGTSGDRIRPLSAGGMSSGHETPMTSPDRSHQLHPLVVPQLGQAWQEPARIICTPHCMHSGASD
jgi:hypothetical protein